MTSADDTARIIAMSEARQEFVRDDANGYIYYAPEGGIHGAFESWMLRALADELDRRNAAWDAQIQSDPRIGGAPCDDPPKP
jgi:hypothetical protein